MKTDSSIKNIALASINRSAMDVHEWGKTRIDPTWFPITVEIQPDELTIVFTFFSDTDWTLITTKKIIGMISGQLNEMPFSEVDDFMLGDFKNLKIEKTIFRITNMYGERADFIMEPGKASMGIIKAIQTIQGLYKSSE